MKYVGHITVWLPTALPQSSWWTLETLGSCWWQSRECWGSVQALWWWWVQPCCSSWRAPAPRAAHLLPQPRAQVCLRPLACHLHHLLILYLQLQNYSVIHLWQKHNYTEVIIKCQYMKLKERIVVGSRLLFLRQAYKSSLFLKGHKNN